MNVLMCVRVCFTVMYVIVSMRVHVFLCLCV